MILRGATILVVDDDHATCAALREILGDEGAEVLDASSAEAALEILAGAVPSLAFIDLVLPNMTGWQLADRMHRDPRLAAVRVCIMTATNTQLPPPVEHVIRKPFNADAIVALARSLCFGTVG
jgi:CheY-like chemotaxis protein